MKFSARFIGQNAIAAMLKEAPDLYFRYVRSETWRFTKRVRATFVREQLKGRPGIFWRGPTGPNARGTREKKALGKNAYGWAAGKRRDNLTAFFRISKFLVWHTEGTTGPHAVPGRLDPEEVFKRLVPEFKVKVDAAMSRASKQLIKKSNKQIQRGFLSSGAAFRVAI